MLSLTGQRSTVNRQHVNQSIACVRNSEISMSGFFTGFLQVVIYNNFIKMMPEGNFISSFAEPVLQGLRRFCGPVFQSVAFNSSMEGGCTKIDRLCSGYCSCTCMAPFTSISRIGILLICFESVAVPISKCHNIFLHTPFPIPQIPGFVFYAGILPASENNNLLRFPHPAVAGGWRQIQKMPVGENAVAGTGLWKFFRRPRVPL